MLKFQLYALGIAKSHHISLAFVGRRNTNQPVEKNLATSPLNNYSTYKLEKNHWRILAIEISNLVLLLL